MTKYAPGERRCYKCAETKPIEQFEKDRNSSQGRTYRCRACANAARNARKRARRAVDAVYDDRMRHQARSYRYGVDVLALWIEQDGACAFCGETLGDDPVSPDVHVDHDHTCCSVSHRSCGRCVRGLVHGACNSRIAGIERRLRKGYTLDALEAEAAERMRVADAQYAAVAYALDYLDPTQRSTEGTVPECIATHALCIEAA